uniref:Uncharacterized protein n=1 Tax=Pinctada fucata TaxID=50426 RepID=A0A194APQ9_PINFU
MFSGLIFPVIGLLLCHKSYTQNYFMEGKCNMNDRHGSCPDGFCCAYDEFFRSIRYCKKYGILNKSCSTVESDQDCRCGDGLICRPFTSGGAFVSIYGRCVIDPNATTTASSTTQSMTSSVYNITTDMTMDNATTVDMGNATMLSTGTTSMTKSTKPTTDKVQNHNTQKANLNPSQAIG